MKLRREDLVEAAGLGLLQYRQIDPLLIFLLQRDILARREALLAEPPKEHPEARPGMLTCAGGMVAIIGAVLFALLVTTQAVESLGIGALFFLTMLYALCAFGLASWFKKRGTAASIRILSGLAVALMPVAIFALDRTIL